MGSKKLVQAERHDLCHVNVFGNIQFFEQQVRPVVQGPATVQVLTGRGFGYLQTDVQAFPLFSLVSPFCHAGGFLMAVAVPLSVWNPQRVGKDFY